VVQFAREIDLLTFEFENIPAATIEWAKREQPIVRPHGDILLTAQNRLGEKEISWLKRIPSRAVLPVYEWIRPKRVRCRRSTASAILKGAAFGYDGKGQERIDPGDGPHSGLVWAQ
jgi:5-(carboxyamino)imidazole ribonucleotide synthase